MPQIQERFEPPSPPKVEMDKTRPYGLVYGHSGFAFEQDGVHFSADGNVAEKWSSPEQIAKERAQAQSRAKREADSAAQRAREQRLRRALEE